MRIRNVINLATHTHTHTSLLAHTLIAPCQRPFAIFHYVAHHSLRRLKANAEKQPNGGRKKPLSTSCLLFAFTWGKQLKVLWISSCPEYVSVCACVCVLMFFSLCNFGNVFINHTQREPVTPCRTTCQCGRYISRQLLQIIYLLSRLDISCTCHKYLCKTNISRAIYTHLIAAYKELRAEVVFRNGFHCLSARKITAEYCELII